MSSNKLINYGFIPGLLGAFLIFFTSFFAFRYNALEHGWMIFGKQISFEKNDSIFFVLIFAVFLMFLTELLIRLIVDEDNFINLSPKIKEKKYYSLFIECALIYFSNLLLFYIIILFYKLAPEYGYKANAEYYKPWFFIMDQLFLLYMSLGIVYIPITRIFQYNNEMEKKEIYHLFLWLINKLIKPFNKNILGNLEHDYKNIILGLIVKVFFIPLMTVFFYDNFTHLTSNFKYLSDVFNKGVGENYNLIKFSNDFYNINSSIIFSIDVGLAWGGYVISSRWINSNNISVEPTTLGWLVAISCYPPFQSMSKYFPFPGERDFFSMPNQYGYVVLIFSVISILSFFIYMSATIFFGLRFSNLTHRGIIKVGLYRYIRHPAYASKNLSWWCIIMPFILYKIFILGDFAASFDFVGLSLITCLYYWRAITEERHLSKDPEYVEYCKQVPYRFIPNVI